MSNEDFRVAAEANPALNLISIIETRCCKLRSNVASIDEPVSDR